MPRTFLTMQDLAHRYHRTPKTIYSWMSLENHPFPKPKIRQHGAGNLWLESDVENWEDGE